MKTTKKEIILKAINKVILTDNYTENINKIIGFISNQYNISISRSYIRKIYKAYISENNNSDNELKHDIVNVSEIIKDMNLISKVKNISVTATFNCIYKEKVNKSLKLLFTEIKDIHKNNEKFNSSFDSLNINYISESDFTNIIDNNVCIGREKQYCCGINTLLTFNRLYNDLIYIKDTIIEFFNNNINNFVIKKSDIYIPNVRCSNYYELVLNLYCYSIITNSFYKLVITQSKNGNDVLKFAIAD